ncbi:MAG: flagellar protein FliT [Sterolibacterium sp.]
MPSQISLYEEMSTLSARMVDAARAQDWDRLVTLEHAVATLRDTLSKYGDNDLSDVDLELKSRLIQQILHDDAEVRRHTEPWMEHVRQFLGSGAKQRQVERAYGATY